MLYGNGGFHPSGGNAHDFAKRRRWRVRSVRVAPVSVTNHAALPFVNSEHVLRSNFTSLSPRSYSLAPEASSSNAARRYHSVASPSSDLHMRKLSLHLTRARSGACDACSNDRPYGAGHYPAHRGRFRTAPRRDAPNGHRAARARSRAVRNGREERESVRHRMRKALVAVHEVVVREVGLECSPKVLDLTPRDIPRPGRR